MKRKFKRNRLGEFATHDYKIKAIRRKKTLRIIGIIILALSALMSVIGYIDTYDRAKSLLMTKYEAITKHNTTPLSNTTITPTLTNQEYLIQELEANFSKPLAYDIYTMIRACENKKLDNNDDNTFGNSKGVDRGIFMINSVYHAEVSNECAYNLECGVKEGIRIFKERGFKEWACGNKLGLTKEYNK